MSEAIKQNDSLIHLDLSSNDIQSRGAAAIFEALFLNKSIISLDISSREGLNRNRIGCGELSNNCTLNTISKTGIINEKEEGL